jgi:MFS family permease
LPHGALIGAWASLRSPGVRSIAVTFVTLALTYGVWYSYSVFLVALLREFGWSRSVVSGAFSVFAFVHGLSGMWLGRLADRVGPRRIVLAGGIVLALALPLDGAIRTPWQLYLAFGLLTGVGVAAAGWVPAVVLVQRWFPRRVGFALGATSAGIGVGITLVVPFSQLLIELLGWRWAFRILGALMVVWVIPATMWLLRDPPAVLAPPPPALRPAGRAFTRGDITLAEATRQPRFWLLGCAQVLGNMASQMLFVHQAVYLVDHGIAAIVAASVVSVVGLASIAGKTGGGWLSDRLGREITYSIGMATTLSSIAVLGLIALAPSPALAYGYAVLLGLGYAVTAPLMPAVISDLFRGRHFGAIFGTLHVANALGGSIGPWVGGRIFDVTGSYRAAFLVGVATAIVSAVLLWIVAPRRARGG